MGRLRGYSQTDPITAARNRECESRELWKLRDLQNGIGAAIFTFNMAFLERFLPVPRTSFFLFGPRGTGKTTWIRETFPSALFVNLLNPQTFREYSARPERLADLVGAAHRDSP
jgi:hypothetical protein